MKEKINITIRRQAGLGDSFFHNNANESMNRRIKQRIEQIKKIMSNVEQQILNVL